MFEKALDHLLEAACLDQHVLLEVLFRQFEVLFEFLAFLRTVVLLYEAEDEREQVSCLNFHFI